MSVDANWRESIGYSQSVRNQRLTDSPPRMNRYWMFTWAGMIFMARRVSPGSPMVSPQIEREGSDQLGRRRLLLPPFWKSCEILWLHICKLVLKLNAYRFTLVQKHPCKLNAQ